jgi:hypothetical protein
VVPAAHIPVASIFAGYYDADNDIVYPPPGHWFGVASPPLVQGPLPASASGNWGYFVKICWAGGVQPSSQPATSKSPPHLSSHVPNQSIKIGDHLISVDAAYNPQWPTGWMWRHNPLEVVQSQRASTAQSLLPSPTWVGTGLAASMRFYGNWAATGGEVANTIFPEHRDNFNNEVIRQATTLTSVQANVTTTGSNEVFLYAWDGVNTQTRRVLMSFTPNTSGSREYIFAQGPPNEAQRYPEPWQVQAQPVRPGEHIQLYVATSNSAGSINLTVSGEGGERSRSATQGAAGNMASAALGQALLPAETATSVTRARPPRGLRIDPSVPAIGRGQSTADIRRNILACKSIFDELRVLTGANYGSWDMNQWVPQRIIPANPPSQTPPGPPDAGIVWENRDQGIQLNRSPPNHGLPWPGWNATQTTRPEGLVDEIPAEAEPVRETVVAGPPDAAVVDAAVVAAEEPPPSEPEPATPPERRGQALTQDIRDNFRAAMEITNILRNMYWNPPIAPGVTINPNVPEEGVHARTGDIRDNFIAIMVITDEVRNRATGRMLIEAQEQLQQHERELLQQQQEHD